MKRVLIHSSNDEEVLLQMTKNARLVNRHWSHWATNTATVLRALKK